MKTRTSKEQAQPEPITEERREQMKRALESLRETMSDVVTAVQEKQGERCPYRNAKDECTYRGGCQNKQRQGKREAPLCGGDQLLKW